MFSVNAGKTQPTKFDLSRIIIIIDYLVCTCTRYRILDIETETFVTEIFRLRFSYKILRNRARFARRQIIW